MGKMYIPMAKQWHIDVDRYTNPWTPRNPIHLLPRPIAHFLGYRDHPEKEVGNVIVAIWALIGAFAGVSVIAATFRIPGIQGLAPPIVIGSFVWFSLFQPGSPKLTAPRVLPQFLSSIQWSRRWRNPETASLAIFSLLQSVSPSRRRSQ